MPMDSMGMQRVSVTSGSGVSIELKNITLNRKDEYGYSLALTYTIDGPNTVQELHIPKVIIPNNPSFINLVGERGYLGIDYTVDLDWKHLGVADNGTGVAFTITTIKEKTKEMTLEEIEKKLGHRVKIVSKETK